LLEQGGPGPRQAQDEDRVRARIAPSRARLKEGWRADPDLFAGVGLKHLRRIAAGRPFQRVAALIVSPGVGWLASILERLAQRKTQMPAVLEIGRRGGLLLGHPRHFVFAESIVLEVGEAP